MSEPIKRNKFGRCDFSVPSLSFGASGLGHVFDETVSLETADACVAEALNAGINLFDTSPFYGLGQSETALGYALRRVPRDDFLLATKVGRYGQTEFDFSAQRTLASFEQSLERLGVARIDVLQAHDVEFCHDINLLVSETIPALQKLKNDGRVRAIGITGLPLTTLQSVLNRLPPHTLDTTLSYCHYTLFDKSLASSPLLDNCVKQGMALINAAPLAMGLLSRRGPPSWHPASEELKATASRASELAHEYGVDIARLALHEAVNSAPSSITTTLVGMISVEQVQFNVHAVTTPLAQEEKQVLAKIDDLFETQGMKNQTWPSGI